MRSPGWHKTSGNHRAFKSIAGQVALDFTAVSLMMENGF